MAEVSSINEPRNGAELIAAERKRQATEEGWSPAHDAEHTNGELACAADAYIFAALANEAGKPVERTVMWPWEASWWKPSPDPVRNLVKAGALIAAEIDRLKRAEWERHLAKARASRGR